MTFREFLKSQEGRDDAVGDLAQDAAYDEDFPETDDYEVLAAYMQGVVDVFTEAYQEYLAA